MNRETVRNEIKARIVREGVSMNEVVRRLAERHGRSASAPAFTSKLKRGSLRYGEAVQIADVLGYDLVWVKRQESEDSET